MALIVGAVAIGGAAPASAESADTGAQSVAGYSPGVGSGNLVQVPIHIPVNVCGNTVNIIGLLNPPFGNACGNT
ncbi:chaplin [Streptomyces sp. NPDC056400]|uniref:chaplin n=1 Tax=unclassified Streptomyces TaxID=2593676 RepID=UPI0035E130FB